MSKLQVPELCRSDECYDEILLHGLQNWLDARKGDVAVILHMRGSHGPAYFKRYPPAYQVYTPVCETNQLGGCGRDSIVNAYDNSIRYTDHVLGETIELLKRNSARFDTAMLYMSDHGESLGEKGLYLHGLPYAFAPSEQTHIPMVLWLSDRLRADDRISSPCVAGLRDEPLSHDNLYYTVLGLLHVQTKMYEPARDLLTPCRPHGNLMRTRAEPTPASHAAG